MRIRDWSSDGCSSDLVRFDAWAAALADPDPLAWRDTLPTAISAPAVATQHPALVRALAQVRQYALAAGGILPWLGLPFALRDSGLSASRSDERRGGKECVSTSSSRRSPYH